MKEAKEHEEKLNATREMDSKWCKGVLLFWRKHEEEKTIDVAINVQV
jgi:hypothetical protein